MFFKFKSLEKGSLKWPHFQVEEILTLVNDQLGAAKQSLDDLNEFNVNAIV
jgi:hypothetical protein